MVGSPTLAAVWLNKFVPGLADRYLARTCYRAQQTQTPVAAGRRDNLFSPVGGDPGAHGRFDAIARPSSLAAWLAMHRAQAAIAFTAGVTLALTLRGRAEGR